MMAGQVILKSSAYHVQRLLQLQQPQQRHNRMRPLMSLQLQSRRHCRVSSSRRGCCPKSHHPICPKAACGLQWHGRDASSCDDTRALHSTGAQLIGQSSPWKVTAILSSASAVEEAVMLSESLLPGEWTVSEASCDEAER